MIFIHILLTGNVYITWLDDVSAFVSLYKKDQSATGIYTHVLVYNFEKGGGQTDYLILLFPFHCSFVIQRSDIKRKISVNLIVEL